MLKLLRQWQMTPYFGLAGGDISVDMHGGIIAMKHACKTY